MAFFGSFTPDRGSSSSVRPPTPPSPAAADSTSTSAEEVVFIPKNDDGSSSSSFGALEGNEKYRAFIDKLMANSNIEKYVAVPMIAVMGDTSSGKSSLLSMLSGIEFPSNDQITTRCPIKLHMSPSPRHGDDSGQSAKVQVQWKGDPVEGTTEQDRFFAPIVLNESSWNDIPSAISKAQEHILSHTGKEVAPDMVVVTLQSPSCERLTLIDLPGIVRATGKNESATLGQDIQHLIDEYLKNPRCVILAVVPCNNDFHNSQIMADARRVDPDTRRTIPVLTKPDLIDNGAESAVQDLLLGNKTDSFEKGFHMVKARGQMALNHKKSIEQAIGSEAWFFKNHSPWSELQKKHPDLFGTKSLRSKLSTILMEIIQASFHDLRKDMELEKDRAFEQLTKMGEIPDSLFAKRISYSHAKDDFIKALQPALLGIGVTGMQRLEADTENCASKYHQICKEYKDVLYASELPSIGQISKGVKAVAMDVSGKEFTGEVALVKDQKVYLKGVFCEKVCSTTPTMEHTSSYSGPSFGTSSTSTSGPVGQSSPSFSFGNRTVQSGFAPVSSSGRSVGQVWSHGDNVYELGEDGTHKLKAFQMDLTRRDSDWIMALNQKHRTYSVPIFGNESVFNSIIAEAIDAQWKQPTLEMVHKISKAVGISVEKILNDDKSLASFPKLLSFLKRESQKVIKALTVTALEQVGLFIEHQKIPYTQDNRLFKSIQSKRNDIMCSLIETQLLCSESNTIHRSEAMQIVKKAFDQQKSKTLDQYLASEMAHAIGGYGMIAVKRFADEVPMTCASLLLHSVADKLNIALTKVDDPTVNRLLSVPEEELALRTRLAKKIQELETVIQAFDDEF